MENKKIYITPKTKIYDLLEEFPVLEETLIEYAPQFKKLKNPVLRKTITRITNIGQAAVIAGLNVEDLVNALRSKVGQDKVEGFENVESNIKTAKPEWFSNEHIVNRIDIREMLRQGDQPVHEVLSQLKKLNEEDILEITAPFIPVPLIDKALSLNYDHWLVEIGKEEFLVYFRRV